ncbi:MAG: Octanoate-[acyl-carrier-protein]-protein-N-octanoyltransferase [uncultured Thiotrichaceae bacterium]|uniref:Octanoyltransferase n=1 Tax=uncultured Thiotrichaceae bacterium TaxID=298394 RepID=A0A6S6SUD3_9GAMM|nr:MAG: Octanoate-[acyl-carrier-protein]-protein-N-octanoyltransferase [uncultured Thiotrichaceae bacterium]
MGALVDTQIRQLGSTAYADTYQHMQTFTEQRDSNSSDEIWILQHEPVYTLGRNGKPHHILRKNNIPVIKIDRGGQVTYHGPGQLIIYLLLDIKRRGVGVRKLVDIMEQAVIDYLASYQIDATRKKSAPGVYVKEKKIAALGLRVTQGCTYHGLSFNIDMDLEPFNDINPCGYENLEVIQCSDFGIKESVDEIGLQIVKSIETMLLTEAG